MFISLKIMIMIFIFWFFIFMFFILKKFIIRNIWIIIDLINQIWKINWVVCIVSVEFSFFEKFLHVSFIEIILINIVYLVLVWDIIIFEILGKLIFWLWISKNLILLINYVKLSCFSRNRQFFWKWNIEFHCLILILHLGNLVF